MRDKIMGFSFKKFFSGLKRKVSNRHVGASIIFWKKVDGKLYVLMAQRRCHKDHYDKETHEMKYCGKYSNLGGHIDNLDYVAMPDGTKKLDYLTTAIRENAEETAIFGRKHLHKQAEVDQAKAFFAQDGFELSPKVFVSSWHILAPWYVWKTYQCKVSGKMADEKWYGDDGENVSGTLGWYPVNHLPGKVCFEGKRTVFWLKIFCALGILK